MTTSASSMLSGVGGASYAANSGLQNSMLLRCKPIIERAIAMQQARLLEMKKLQQQKKKKARDSSDGDEHIADDDDDDENEKVFRIADMGCSSGPNCLVNMHFMVEAVKKYHTTSSSSSCSQLQAFYCDLPSNDFNTLFQLQQTRFGGADDGQDCFQAAVAGTVYGRLFPASSLHLVFSSWCLHWLSETPKSISIPSTLEWNKGKIWVDGANEATGKAYAHQWQHNIYVFFRFRNQEMVIGGMIILVIPCRDDSFPPHQMSVEDRCFENLELSWHQLIQEGVLQQEDMDTFNLPVYFPTVQEIITAISSIPNFQVQSLEVIKQTIGDNFWKQWGQDPDDLVARVHEFYKSITWNVTEGHVGTTKCESIFCKFRELLKTSMQSRSYYDPYWADMWSSCVVVQVFKDS